MLRHKILFTVLFILSQISFLFVYPSVFSGVFVQAQAPTPTQRQTQAQTTNLICEIFPFLGSLGFGISSFCSGGSTNEAIQESGNLIRFVLSLVFVGIILVSVFVIIKAALKYIQSEGNQGKVEEAKKAIQNVFVGIGALFVGILGLIIALAFFGATGAVQTNIPNNPVLNQLREQSGG